MSSLDYLELCRLCLVKENVNLPIFDDDVEAGQIHYKISATLPVKVEPDDKLPKKICQECGYKVELLYQFVNTSVSAEKQLLHWLGQVGGLEDKQGYVTEVLDSDVLKSEGSGDNRLDSTVMQVTEAGTIDMNMIDNMSIITMPDGSEQQFTTVPIDDSGTVQTVQVVAGPSTETTHDQITQSQVEEVEDEEEDNYDDGCDNDDSMAVKEETEEDQNERNLEPTFVNVTLPCDEAGPSGLQQKISNMSEITSQTADDDPKPGCKRKIEIEEEEEKGLTLYHISYPNGKTVLSVCQGDVGKLKNFFKCSKCELCFATETRLKYHQATHTPLKQQQKQPIRRSLEQNSNKNSKKVEGKETKGVATYKCPSCRFSTNRRDVMIKHYTNSHWNKSDGTSENTKEIVISDEEMEVQIIEEKVNQSNDSDIEEHFEPVKLTCSNCGFICNNQDDFDFHSCEAKNQEMFTCKLCTFECPTRMGLQSHVTRKHKTTNADGTIVRSYECEKCDYKCANRRTMYSHRRKHREGEPISPPRYFCSECDFKARTKGALYIHIQRRHKVVTEENKEKPATEGKKPVIYKCDQCDYTNKNRYEMKVHVIRKHSNQYNYECETCGKKYKIRGDLTNHIRFQHREQPIICDVCGKTCGNSNSLYVHQKFAHYKAEFECHICHRRMVSQANLDEHILKQHEQREDVVCEECGKTFTRSTRLKIHMRIHSGIKPYNCKICGKAFSRKTALRQHLLIHSGQRPYQCDICGKAFTQKPGLISHRKSHPGNHPPLPRVTIDHVLSNLLNND